MMRAMRRGWNRHGPAGLAVGLCLGAQAVLAASPGAVPDAAPGSAPAPISSPAAAVPPPEPVAELRRRPAADSLTVSEDLARALWRPKSDLAPERAVGMPPFCGGGYLSLDFPFPVGADSDGYPIDAAGDTASYQVDGEVVLIGNVRIDQGNRTLKAARAELDHATGRGRAEGGVLLVQPGTVLQGDRADIDTDTGAAELEDVQFVLLDSEFRGVADALAQDEAGTLLMTRGNFTRCEPGNGNWRIGASQIEVEQDSVFGVARHAVVRVRGVPVFYTPRIRFPVTDDRQSGWMFPNLAYSDEDGTDVSVPYYLNLAPNYDATLLPRYVSRRGAGLEGEFRHMSGWQDTTLSGAILGDDDLYNGTYDRDDFEALVDDGEIVGEFVPEDRWLYAMDHSGVIGNVQTRVDYTAVSDRDYFRDLGSDLGVSSRIELERRGEIQYASGGLFMRVWAQRFQRLDEARVDPYQRLPEVEMTYTGSLPGPLEWSLGAEFVTFTRDNDDLTGLGAAVGDRVHLEPRIRLPLAAPWGFLTLAGGFRHTSYDLSDVPTTVEAKPERNIGLGSAHGGLFFERDLTLFGKDLVQTLEPQLFYLYQEYADQQDLPLFDATQLTFGYGQLFRDNRFSGLDRIGDANQLSTGVTTRFIDPRSGREYLRASLGEIVYFDDRRVTLGGSVTAEEERTTSALAAEMAARVASDWSISGTVVWDKYDNRTEEVAAGIQYRSDNRHIVNLGYRKRLANDIDQTDLSVYWPITRHFAVMGRWNYDVVSGRTIEGFGGIEYNDCCWRLRLMARRFLDSPTGRNLEDVEADEGIFLQVVFKGLAGLGSKMESVLQRGIKGYRPETATNGFTY